ncbi:MAG: hypothetical protein RQ728_01630 [Brevefilum sp.]|nr:hypothetical protein [Brevefilum sp.]
MSFNILVFNKQSLGVIDSNCLRSFLMEVHFDTLCSQYGLDPSLIESARTNLAVVVSKAHRLPFFLIEYGDDNGCPLIVTESDFKSERGSCIYNDLISEDLSEDLKSHLKATNFLVEIELMQHQLSNMGLLLAYEAARWAAFKGGGIIFGLDRAWYHLNHYCAILPLE